MSEREIRIILDSVEGVRKDIARLYDRLNEKPCGRNTERIKNNERQITQMKKEKDRGTNLFFKGAVIVVSLLQAYLMYKALYS
nr:hypothetical protein 21 [bacterium]